MAVEGHTRLSAASFRQAAVAGVELEYVRIDRILAADGTDPEARVIRYDTESSPGSSTGKVLRMLVKAGGEDGRTTASPPQLTAYEVIRVDGGISRADAIKRAAGPQDGIHSHDATPGTLSHFVIEYNDYQSPLGIQGADGQVTPILEGQTIHATDLDRLVWNGDQNRVGTIRLQAVLTGEGPDYSNNVEKPEFSVPQDWIRQLPARLFQGVDLSRQPHFIKIVGVEENGAPDIGNAKSPLILHLGTNQERAVDKGAIIHRFDFDKLHWNSKQNSGGSLRFIALDARQTVAHDSTTAAIDRVFFDGADAAKAPAWIRITNVTETADSDTGHSALTVARAGLSSAELKVGDIVAFDDFDHLRWDARTNTGGRFSFQALDQHKQPIAGSAVQTITIHEQQAAPGYPGNGLASQSFPLGTTGFHVLDNGIFNGIPPVNKPTFIRITEVSTIGTNHQADDHPVLYRGNEAGDQKTPLSADDLLAVPSSDFDKLFWDSTHNIAGSFRFQALDQPGGHTSPPDGQADKQPATALPEQAAHSAGGEPATSPGTEQGFYSPTHAVNTRCWPETSPTTASLAA